MTHARMHPSPHADTLSTRRANFFPALRTRTSDLGFCGAAPSFGLYMRWTAGAGHQQRLVLRTNPGHATHWLNQYGARMDCASIERENI